VTVYGSDASSGRLLVAALCGATVPAVGFVALVTGPAILDGAAGSTADTLLALLVAGAESLAWYAPLLAAVVFVGASGTALRVVVLAAAGLFGAVLALALARGLWGPFGVTSAVLTVPAAQVVRFFAVTTALRIAPYRGFDRLADRTGGLSHPLAGAVREAGLWPDRALVRPFAAALVAGVVAVAGLLAVGGLADLLATLPLDIASGPVVAAADTAGIRATQVPRTFLSEAAFALAVVVVVGSRPTPRSILAALGVIYAVQAPVELLPPLLAGRTVALWAVNGPLVIPASDAAVVLGLALATWLVGQ
jgi:hypothetical protein